MKDFLLTEQSKKKILKLIKEGDYPGIVSCLEKIKTSHAETAKTKDKQFVIREILKFTIDNSKNPKKELLKTGMFFCNEKEPVAREIGVALVWRGYSTDPETVKEYLLKIADDPNWEVREYAANAFANTLFHNPDFYDSVMQLSEHPSENIRRAVVFSALALRDKDNLEKAFAILEPLLYDSSRYVKKSLGPFIIGSHFGNKFPKETIRKLKKWSRIKDENVRWNVIMAFNNSFGNKYPKEALSIFEKLAGDVNLTVKRALMSTLNFLNKKHSQLVEPFLTKHKLIEEVS